MRAFITGISGFAGRHLARLLFSRQVEVCGLAQGPSLPPSWGPESHRIRYFQGDVRNQEQLGACLDEVRPDWVFHLAGRTSPAASLQQARPTFEVNLLGTLALLESVRISKLPCRVLVVSSAHVYGKTAAADKPVREETLPKPETPYAASKAAAELLAYQYWRAYQVESVIVRSFNHTGPGQGKGFVCPDIASQVAEIEAGRRPPQIVTGDLDAEVDLTDVRDIVEGYCLAIQKGSPGEVYNLCSGKAIAVRELVNKFLALARRNIAVHVDPARVQAGKAKVLLGDNSRARREFGWNPSIPLDRSLNELLDDWRREASTVLGDGPSHSPGVLSS